MDPPDSPVLTLGQLRHVICLDGRNLDTPLGPDVHHEGRHHAVVMMVRRQVCRGARTARQATTSTTAPAADTTPTRLRPSPTPAAPAASTRSLHHADRTTKEEVTPNSHVPTPTHSHNSSHTRSLLLDVDSPAFGRLRADRRMRGDAASPLPATSTA